MLSNYRQSLGSMVMDIIFCAEESNAELLLKLKQPFVPHFCRFSKKTNLINTYNTKTFRILTHIENFNFSSDFGVLIDDHNRSSRSSCGITMLIHLRRHFFV